MRHLPIAAAAAMLCHAAVAAAEERPSHDPAVEAAAIAILQKKLPEIRKSHGIADRPVIVRGPDDAAKPQGIAAIVEPGEGPSPTGRILWL